MDAPPARPLAGELLLPVGWGEFLDRLTIQELKAARLPEDGSRAVAAEQLARLERILEATIDAAPVSAGMRNSLPDDVRESFTELRRLNAALWDAESAVREARQLLDSGGDDDAAARFCRLAREILAGNERRAAIKRAIDVAMGHRPEAKHYAAAE
jgi:hypothetical protein